MVLVRTETCQGSHRDAVLKLSNPDAERLEKSRHRRRGHDRDVAVVLVSLFVEGSLYSLKLSHVVCVQL